MTHYRAEHIGSLLRPPELLEARAAHAAGELSAAGLREIEDASISKVLDLQRQIGLDVFTDGEYRRDSWLFNISEAVEGFVPDHVVIEWRGPGAVPEGSAGKVVGARLRQTRPLTAHEATFLEQHSPGPFKITTPAPSVYMLGSYKVGVTDRVYPSRFDLLHELVGIVRGEVQLLAGAGVPYVQLDAPQYTHYVDARMRERLAGAGLDLSRAFDEAIAADNACLAGLRRDGLTLGIHICRGNSRSRWFTEGGYDTISEKLFGTLDVDRFLLEYDTERAGGFEPLRFVPPGKTVVLGLITTKEPRLEDEDRLLRRIDEASRYVPVENLAISPQCGFASVAAGNLISWDDQLRKLELVVKVAHRVWS